MMGEKDKSQQIKTWAESGISRIQNAKVDCLKVMAQISLKLVTCS